MSDIIPGCRERTNFISIGMCFFIKVQLTLNMTFGICNIWVILRRNVIYLYSENPHLHQLSLSKFSDMMSY